MVAVPATISNLSAPKPVHLHESNKVVLSDSNELLNMDCSLKLANGDFDAINNYLNKSFGLESVHTNNDQSTVSSSIFSLALNLNHEEEQSEIQTAASELNSIDIKSLASINNSSLDASIETNNILPFAGKDENEINTPWSIKFFKNSPFPTINSKISDLFWFKREKLFFIGWEQGAELINGAHLYEIEIQEKKDRIYKVKQVHSDKFLNKELYRSFGFYEDAALFTSYKPCKDDIKNDALFNHLYVFHQHGLAWTTDSLIKGIKPPKVFGHASLNLKINGEDFLYIFGGITKTNNETKSFNDIWIFNLSSKSENNRWRKISPITGGDIQIIQPPRLYGHSMTKHGNKIYIYGGRNFDTNQVSNQLWSFDLNKETWELHNTFGKTLVPVYEHKACNAGKGYLIIYGGKHNFKDFSNSMFIINLFNFKVGTVDSNLINTPCKRTNFQMTFDFHSNKLIIFGGEKVRDVEEEFKQGEYYMGETKIDTNDPFFNQVYEFDFAKLKDYIKF